MKIQKYLNEKHKYRVDRSYQRPNDAWSNSDKQCLIDTILRGEPMPLFFFNYKTDEGLYYIVDGQQRLKAIKDFATNNIKLNRKFSESENHGKTFNADNPLTDDQRNKFLNYDLRVHIVEDYDDEKVRFLFSRLQRGKPLSIGERLNALPGDVVVRMREIASHPFMKKSITVQKRRYGNYPDAARILYYEKYGARDMKTDNLYKLFDNERDMKKSDKAYKNAISTLNFLSKCFPPEQGGYSHLEKHAWVLAVYTMVRELRIAYSLEGKEKAIADYIKDFHGKVYDEDFRRSDVDYQRFYENVRGGWSEKIIKLRRKILINKFTGKEELEGLGDRRQISDEEKIAKFAEIKNCEICNRSFKDYKEPEYHHKVKYSEGGGGKENIMVLCSECHKKVHGKEKIGTSSENETTENEW